MGTIPECRRIDDYYYSEQEDRRRKDTEQIREEEEQLYIGRSRTGERTHTVGPTYRMEDTGRN